MSSKIYKCQQCDAVFTHHLALAGHKKTHMSTIDRLMSRTPIKQLGINMAHLTEEIIEDFNKIYNSNLYNEWDCVIVGKLIMKPTVSLYDDYITIKNTPHHSKLYYQILYGDELGLIFYNNHITKLKIINPAFIEHWADTGMSFNDAKNLASHHRIKISKKGNTAAVKIVSGTSKHSVRSIEYWINQGLSVTDAMSKVTHIQTKNGLEYYTSKYGAEGIQKYIERIEKWKTSIKITNLKLGVWSSDNTDLLNRYRKDIKNMTKCNYKKYKNLINPGNLLKYPEYELDHRYSCHEGFKNNVDPAIIAHWTNLELITSLDNANKWIRCSITLDQLLQNIESNTKIF